MANSKKIMASLAVLVSTLSAITFIGYSFSQVLMDKATTSITKYKQIDWTREDEGKSQDRYIKNALEKDAQEKAKSDSVLFYKISTNGVITRFSVVAHIMRILELNPKKEIRVYAVDSLNLDTEFFDNKDKFPNFKFRYFDKSYLESSINNFVKYNYNIQFLEEIYEEFGKDKIIDGYFDDYSFFTKILLYVNGLNSPRDRLEIWNQFSLLSKLESISFISDGTLSVEFFFENVKKAFLLSNNLYDNETLNYSNAKSMREKMKNDEVTKEEFLKGNNALLYLTSLITWDREVSKTSKYFLPTTDFIGEVNRLGGGLYKNGVNDVFSPFNAQNLDVVGMIKNLDQDAIKSVLKIDAEYNPEIYIKAMENHDNYVYAGTLLSTPEIAKSAINTLIAIREFAIKTTPDTAQHDKIIVWFKGHPRDKDILEKLRTSILLVTNGQDDGSWINVLNHKVPFEFYSISNVFASNPTTNKKVFIFTTYSTLVMTNYAEEPRAEIAKIIIDNTSIFPIERIISIYGRNSKIFPEDKMTTLKDFEELYS
ncbi:MAG: hypothetical protein ACRCWU_02255 [Metamycoplasmataceae bacterium]